MLADLLRGSHPLVTPSVSAPFPPEEWGNRSGDADRADPRVAAIRRSPLNDQVQINPLAVRENDNIPSERAQKLSYV